MTVRLFAALRDAAGTSRVELPAGRPIADVLDDLRDHFDRRFAERLELAAIMIDGRPADRDSTAPIPAGAEVALLPPFAGG